MALQTHNLLPAIYIVEWPIQLYCLQVKVDNRYSNCSLLNTDKHACGPSLYRQCYCLSFDVSVRCFCEVKFFTWFRLLKKCHHTSVRSEVLDSSYGIWRVRAIFYLPSVNTEWASKANASNLLMLWTLYRLWGTKSEVCTASRVQLEFV